jgi:hypothetical protein
MFVTFGVGDDYYVDVTQVRSSLLLHFIHLLKPAGFPAFCLHTSNAVSQHRSPNLASYRECLFYIDIA